jgi:hypothetical protein
LNELTIIKQNQQKHGIKAGKVSGDFSGLKKGVSRTFVEIISITFQVKE